jgi:hypothetical protein
MSRVSGSESSIDPICDQLLPLAQAIKLYPLVNGKRASLQSIYRHSSRGCRGITLDTIAVGGKVYTTAKSINLFFSLLSDARRNGCSTSLAKVSQSDSVRRQAIEKAKHRAEKLLGTSQKNKKPSQRR